MEKLHKWLYVCVNMLCTGIASFISVCMWISYSSLLLIMLYDMAVEYLHVNSLSCMVLVDVCLQGDIFNMGHFPSYLFCKSGSTAHVYWVILVGCEILYWT